MGRPSNKEERRAQIIGGLQIAMAEKGYEKASIQSIAKAAGLSSGLIHYHFKTKQEILVALINNLNNAAQDRFNRYLEQANTPTERLHAYIDAALALGADSDTTAVSAWVLISAEAVRQEEVQKIYQESVQANVLQIETLLDAVKNEKALSLTKKEIKELASMILASIEGCYQLATTSQAVLPQGFAAKTLKRLIGGLG
ncbi:MAG: TetR/AcrR family bet gene transcriptional repressor [Oceanicoccus sp.]|jgi:TetR/AcrR family transcriptional repressor of bet genes